MKYIDADKLKAEIKRRHDYENEMYHKKKPDGRPNEGWAESLAIMGVLEELLAFIDSLQQEQPSEICSKCIHHGKDDDYCYNPHGGMQSLINENGVYECTGFCEHEQPEVDLEKDVESWFFNEISSKINVEHTMSHYFQECARRYYELGKNSK